MRLLEMFRKPAAAQEATPSGPSKALTTRGAEVPQLEAAHAIRAEAHRRSGDRADLELAALSGLRSAESLERIETLLGGILAALPKSAA